MKYLSLIFGAIVIAGCVHRAVICPTIRPSALVAEKLPYSVGIIFSDEMKNYEEHATPDSGGHLYEFEIGSSLCRTLTRSVEATYEKVAERETQPKASEYERILKFSLQLHRLEVCFQQDYSITTAHAHYALSVGIEAYDGESLELLETNTAGGRGSSSKATDAMSAAETFASAIEDGIQMLSDNVANLLISGFAEPKETE